LFIYARKTGNGNLKAISEVTRSGLERLRDLELFQKAKAILENFSDNIEEMKKNGMTDQSLAELDVAVNDYGTAIGNKDSKQVEGKAIRKDLDASLMKSKILKNEIPELYNQYKTARIIKDLGQPRMNAEKGKGKGREKKD
jgi:hypothetical protein